MLLIVDEDVSVEQVENRVGDDEDQQVEPDELDDAAVPDQHHLEEALARPLRVLIPVGEHVGSVFGHFALHSFHSFFFFYHSRKKSSEAICQTTSLTWKFQASVSAVCLIDRL